MEVIIGVKRRVAVEYFLIEGNVYTEKLEWRLSLAINIG